MLTWPAGICYFVIGVASSAFSELENFHGDVVHSPGTASFVQLNNSQGKDHGEG